MKTKLIGAVLAVAGGLLLLPSGAGAQAAPSVTATGWWSRSPIASAPAGGLAVGRAPDGPTSVAAIRLQLGSGVTKAVIELDEVGATGSEIGAVVACGASNDWEAVERGALGDAPRTDCSASPTEDVTRDASTLTWSVDVTELVAGKTGEVSIALIPMYLPQTSSAGGVSAFDVQWAGPPSLTATAAATPSVTTTTGLPAASSTGSASPAASGGPTVARPAASTATLNVTPAPVARPVMQVETTTTTAAGGAPATPPTTASSFTSTGAAAQVSGGGDSSGRPYAQAVFFLVVSAIAGVLAGAGRWFATRR